MSEELFRLMLERRRSWEWFSTVAIGELDREIIKRCESEGLTLAEAQARFARIIGG